MVIKGYNSKASLFATASVSRDFSHFSFPTPFKIISQVMFFSVFFNATNKNFSTVQWAPGLWESSLEVPSGPQLPSTLCGLAFMAAVCALPHCSQWLLRLASVVSKLGALPKSFRSCSGSLGDADLDMTTVETGRLQRCFLGGVHGRKE